MKASDGAAAISATQFLGNVTKYIINPLIILMFATGILVFFWGLFQVIYKADEEDARADGRRHMLYGVIGIMIMSVAVGLVNLLKGFITGGK